jgi:hypothetical protein
MQGTPVLALCLLGFTRGKMPSALKAVIYGLLGVVSLANTILFVAQPNLYLAARSGAFAYDRLFQIVPWIHLGFWVDLLGQAHVQLIALSCCCALIGILGFASIYRLWFSAAVATLILLAGFDAHRARLIRCSAKLEGNAVGVAVLERDVRIGPEVRLRLRAPWRVDVPGLPIVISDEFIQWQTESKATILLRTNDKYPFPSSFYIAPKTSEAGVFDPAEIQIVTSESWLTRAL